MVANWTGWKFLGDSSLALSELGWYAAADVGSAVSVTGSAVSGAGLVNVVQPAADDKQHPGHIMPQTAQRT